jgi:hypothetical protein
MNLPGLGALLVVLLAAACEPRCGDVDSVFFGFDSGGRCDTAGGPTRYADVDGDGFGDADAALPVCSAPDDFVTDATDCNDGDPSVNPAAAEVCGDEIDQDCDGVDLACDTAG